MSLHRATRQNRHGIRRKRRGLNTVIGTLFAAALLLSTAPAAFAEGTGTPPVDPFATEITSIDLASGNGGVTNGSTTSLDLTWQANRTWTDGDGPVTVAFTLPTGLSVGWNTDATFPIFEPNDNTAQNGTCAVDRSANSVTCTVDADYVEAHPEGLHGSVHMTATVNVTQDQDSKHTFTIDTGSHTILVREPQSAGQCSDEDACAWKPPTGVTKRASYSAGQDTINWTIVVPTQATGITSHDDGSMASGQTITVTDHLLNTRDYGTHEFVDRDPVVKAARCLNKRGSGEWGLYGDSWQTLADGVTATRTDADTWTVTITTGELPRKGRWSCTGEAALKGTAYLVQYVTKPTDLGTGGTRYYANEGTVTVGDFSGSVVRELRYRAAGGTALGGIGENPETPENPENPEAPDVPEVPEAPENPQPPLNATPPPLNATPALPTVQQSVCAPDTTTPTAPTVDVPEDIDGIRYALTGTIAAGSAVTVTATAQPGFVFPTTIDGWTVTEDGSTAAHDAVLTEAICVAGESKIVPEAPEAPIEVEGITDEVTDATQQVTDAPELATGVDAATPALAYTGIKTATLGWIALLLLGGGAVLVGATRRGKASRRS